MELLFRCPRDVQKTCKASQRRGGRFHEASTAMMATATDDGDLRHIPFPALSTADGAL
jgi:hypothetical protein